MQVALRHPGRCSRLVLLVPAANLTGADPVDFSPMQERLVRTLLGSDLWFWAALGLAPGRMMRTLLATEPALLDRVSSAERDRARLMLHAIMPVRERAAGMLRDARAAGGPAGIDPAGIGAPTLAVSARDDLFGTATTAHLLSRTIPNAELLVFEDGGHIFLGRQDEMSEAVVAFLRATEG
jgi:pimeloyl-ACP methyl ester carboxylesterase